MEYAIYLCIGTIFLCIIFCLYLIFINKHINEKDLSYVSLIFIISIGILAFCFKPTARLDLYQHFKKIDSIKSFGINNATVDIYNDNIGIKYLFYFVSLLQNNHFLPLFSVLLTYGIGIYIINDYNKLKKCRGNTVAFSIFIMISFASFLTVVSGVRNAMAMALIGLGIYNDYIKHLKLKNSIICYLFAISIHSVSYFIVFFLILEKIIKIKKINFIFLMWGLILNNILNLLRFIRFYNIYNTLLIYINSEEFFDNVTIYISRILFVLALCIICVMLKRKIQNDENNVKYINMIQSYSYFILGSIFVAQIFIGRLCILLGFILMPILDLIERKFHRNEKIIVYGLLSTFLVTNIAFSLISTNVYIKYML